MNIYNYVIKECVNAIEYGKYDFTYKRYKNSVIDLENELIFNKHQKTKKLK